MGGGAVKLLPKDLEQFTRFFHSWIPFIDFFFIWAKRPRAGVGGGGFGACQRVWSTFFRISAT